jgi:hypothetical protein
LVAVASLVVVAAGRGQVTDRSEVALAGEAAVALDRSELAVDVTKERVVRALDAKTVFAPLGTEEAVCIFVTRDSARFGYADSTATVRIADPLSGCFVTAASRGHADRIGRVGGEALFALIAAGSDASFRILAGALAGSIWLSHVRLWDVRLWDVRLCDVRLCDVRLGDVRLGDIRLRCVRFRSVRRGVFRTIRGSETVGITAAGDQRRGEADRYQKLEGFHQKSQYFGEPAGAFVRGSISYP